LNIVFINPSLRLGAPTKWLPVGVGSVMTFIKSHGYEFDLLDIDIHDHDDAYVEQYVSTHKYDIVMTGSIATHYKWMKWLTKTIKKYHPETKIIVGNSVAGSIPKVFLSNSRADVAVIGEGEYTALEVLNAYRENKSLESVEGIAFKDSAGEIIQTPKRKACDINELPLVDWKLFDYKKYFEKSDHAGAEGLIFDENNAPRVMPVLTARGCTFKCTFCHFVFWDDPYRFRAPENVLKEIKRNIEEYGATYFNFWDDLSFASLKQAEDMADAILDSGLKFNWNAAVRVDLFGNPRYSYEKRLAVAKKFKSSGCLNVGFSLESGNQEILDMMDKVIKVEYFAEQIKILKEVGITCSTSVVFGYPIETKETIQETFDMCLASSVYPSIGYLLPLPYTGMYEYGKKHGFITDEDAYLDSITERQDLCLNMTKMLDQEVMDCIKEGASRLNVKLKLGLNSDSLIKTGGARKHTHETSDGVGSLPIDPENLKVNENDFSFNYSQALFDIDLGTGTEAKAKTDARKKNAKLS
jgi:anaerobic magnesium-protoporphyrin IX monomethyl ester cyclase